MSDMHASHLIRSLFHKAEEVGLHIQVDAMAGPRSKEAGSNLICDTSTVSSIGILGAIKQLRPAWKNQRIAMKHVRDVVPDVAIMIDYPGINIPFQRFLKKKLGVKCVYYIPPNEWLWSPTRTLSVRDHSDLVLSVFPAEFRHFQEIGASVHYVGHPLVDQAKERISKTEARSLIGIRSSGPVVVLLPASRKQEVKHVWPILAKAAARIRDRLGAGRVPTFLLPLVRPDFERDILSLAKKHGLEPEEIVLWRGDSKLALCAADVALTKSGSVNVELALLGVPQVVTYKLDETTVWIARLLGVDFEHVSLVNVIMGERIVPEYIQGDADPKAIAEAALKFLPGLRCHDLEMLNKQLNGYSRMEMELGGPGASDRVAEQVLTLCRSVVERQDTSSNT